MPGWRDRWIVGAFALGTVIRVAMVIGRLGDAIPFSDAFWYSAQASALRRGLGFNDLFTGDPTAEHGPLTPILLALVSAGDAGDHQRLLMSLFGIIGLAVLMLVAVRLLPFPAARIACALAAVYPNLWMHESIVMSEAIAIALVSITMLAMLWARQTAVWWAAALVGLAVGFAALARSELVLMAPLCAFAIWRFHRRTGTGSASDSFVRRPIRLRRSAEAPKMWGSKGGKVSFSPLLVLGAAAVVLAPWVGFNLARFDEPTYLTTNDGTTWLGANCDEAWYDEPGSWNVLCVLGDDELAGVDDSVRSRVQREQAREYVADHLDRLPVVLLARGARLLDLYGLADMRTGDIGEDKFGWVIWLGTAMWWVLAPLAIIGLVTMGWRDRAILLPPIVVVLVVTFAFYGAHRIRAPLEPAVVLAAAAGAHHLLDQRASRRRTRVPVAE